MEDSSAVEALAGMQTPLTCIVPGNGRDRNRQRSPFCNHFARSTQDGHLKFSNNIQQNVQRRWFTLCASIDYSKNPEKFHYFPVRKQQESLTQTKLSSKSYTNHIHKQLKRLVLKLQSGTNRQSSPFFYDHSELHATFSIFITSTNLWHCQK